MTQNPLPGSAKRRIATRRSPLALWQANESAQLLQQWGYETEIVPTVTTGDRIQKSPLALAQFPADHPARQHTSTGKGLFIKEVQDLLLQGDCHLAVHSMKDLPVTQTPDLALCGFLQPASPRDVLVLNPTLAKNLPAQLSSRQLLSWINDQALSHKLPLGTTSTRRQALLRAHGCANAELTMLRGNVDSRLKRLRAGEFAAILLAEAGLRRLDLFEPAHMMVLDDQIFVPACAQGVVGLETRCDDLQLGADIFQRKSPAALKTHERLLLERLVLFLLEGDCHSVIGIHQSQESGTLGVFTAPDAQASSHNQSSLSLETPWLKEVIGRIQACLLNKEVTTFASAFTQVQQDTLITQPLIQHLSQMGHMKDVKANAPSTS